MQDQTLEFVVRCSNEACLYHEGINFYFEYGVVNRSAGDVAIPLEFAQSTGPGINLVDTRTRQEGMLATQPAKFSVADNLTVLRPGQSAFMR